jgi:hypothetical protein
MNIIEKLGIATVAVCYFYVLVRGNEVATDLWVVFVTIGFFLFFSGDTIERMLRR